VMRFLSDSAARSVKVKATIWQGSTPSSMSEQTRREMASVLPAPAHAMTWRWPPRCAITCCCSIEGVKGTVLIGLNLVGCSLQRAYHEAPTATRVGTMRFGEWARELRRGKRYDLRTGNVPMHDGCPVRPERDGDPTPATFTKARLKSSTRKKRAVLRKYRGQGVGVPCCGESGQVRRLFACPWVTMADRGFVHRVVRGGANEMNPNEQTAKVLPPARQQGSGDSGGFLRSSLSPYKGEAGFLSSYTFVHCKTRARSGSTRGRGSSESAADSGCLRMSGLCAWQVAKWGSGTPTGSHKPLTGSKRPVCQL
jgi:hypothetical protein